MSAALVSADEKGAKPRVFVSYSRKDIEFTDRLDVALKTRGFEVSIDREEIFAFEDWWKRIEALIGRSDTIIFVLSPDAVKSDVTLKEIAYAASLHKRFAPIVHKRVEDRVVPDVLRRLNFIFFDDPARFDLAADQLAAALQTNIDWIRRHTEYGEITRRWLASGQQDGLLLRSPFLEEAEHWIASRPPGTPEPTSETRLFISESRRTSTRRKWRMLTLLAGFAAVLVAILTSWENQDWLKQRIYAAMNVSALTAARERLLKPNDTFQECAKCPTMVVVAAGSYTLGWGGIWKELPLRNVTFNRHFAISRFEVTFDEWSACVGHGPCDPHVDDQNQKGRHSVGNLSWDDAHSYVRWLSAITGRTYRLLSEAEYEYAVRTGVVELGGWEIFQDCWHESLQGAPSDGSPWIDGASCSHVARVYKSRLSLDDGARTRDLGFRIGRNLSAEVDAPAVTPHVR